MAPKRPSKPAAPVSMADVDQVFKNPEGVPFHVRPSTVEAVEEEGRGSGRTVLRIGGHAIVADIGVETARKVLSEATGKEIPMYLREEDGSLKKA